MAGFYEVRLSFATDEELKAIEAGGKPKSVHSVRGVARVGRGAGWAAEIVDPDASVGPDQQVTAAKDSVVRPGTNPPGNSLLLMGECGFSNDGIEIEIVERHQVAVRVSGVTGQLVFDMEWGQPRVELELGGIRVKGWKGLYALQQTGGQCAVKFVSDRVEVTDKLGQFTLVTEGQKSAFKAGASKGETVAFDSTSEVWK
ncbi:MAG: hypothetical protein HY816_04565 [Candidatus Wallbacteria bacterium]|nr:hypothetical protein [Candidatus Wallbacteria bacterium]